MANSIQNNIWLNRQINYYLFTIQHQYYLSLVLAIVFTGLTMPGIYNWGKIEGTLVLEKRVSRMDLHLVELNNHLHCRVFKTMRIRSANDFNAT